MKDLLTLTKIKNGDVKAFEQVFRLYYMPLCMFAASITGRMDIAEEIVQELFYVFWKERERLQLFHTIKSYLYGAVRNQSLQYWEHQDVRNRYRDAILSHPDKDDTPDDPQEQIEYKELEALVNRTLEKLPERRLRIFRMFSFMSRSRRSGLTMRTTTSWIGIILASSVITVCCPARREASILRGS